MTRGLQRLRAFAAALVVLGAAGALTACGSGGDDSVSPDAIAQAATTTSAEQGAAVSVHANMTAAALGGRTLSFTGAGVEDLAHRAGRVSIDMSKLAQASGAQGVDPSKLRMDTIYVNQHMYMHSPLSEGRLPAGKTWVGVDLRRALASRGIDPSALTQGNPADYLRYLRATSGKVTRVGTEQVRGVETTHYKATVDVRRTPHLDRSSAERLIQASGTATIPTEVWIDRKHLVRRLRLQLSMKMPANAGAAAGQRFDIDETMELFNFGPKPKIVPPPAGQVWDVTDKAATAIPQR